MSERYYKGFDVCGMTDEETEEFMNNPGIPDHYKEGARRHYQEQIDKLLEEPDIEKKKEMMEELGMDPSGFEDFI